MDWNIIDFERLKNNYDESLFITYSEYQFTLFQESRLKLKSTILSYNRFSNTYNLKFEGQISDWVFNSPESFINKMNKLGYKLVSIS